MNDRLSRLRRRRFLQTSALFPARSLVQTGSLAGLGLSLPQLLQAETLHQPATARSCIFIVLSGGPGQHETFDPKPQAPAEIRGQYSAIATATPGIQLSEMLPQLAVRTDRYCLVRSMSHGDPVHVTAAHTMLTGQQNGSPANESPMLGSLVSRFRPADVTLPSHVWLHNMKTGTGKVPRYDNGLQHIGQQHAPMRVGYELENPSHPDFRVTQFDPPPDVSAAQLKRRFELLQGLQEGPLASGLLTAPTDRYVEFQQKAFDLVHRPVAREAFELHHESAQMRDRYGRHPLGQYLLMSRRLIEAGVRLVTVTGWPGLAPGETTPTVTQVWDTHDEYYHGNDNMYGNGPYGMKWALPRLDQAVSALLDDLSDRGLLHETLVVAVGEFGRTPRFEGHGRGRGHWPHCYTSLLAGGGVTPGLVYGSSDQQAAFVASGRPVSHADFGATVLTALGIPLNTRYGADGFSMRVSEGSPLTEIFGQDPPN